MINRAFAGHMDGEAVSRSILRQCAELELELDRAEGIRFAYAAATRARELLMGPTIDGDPRQSWDSVENWRLRPLYDAIYPAAKHRQQSETAPACPKFGKGSVLVRPPDLSLDEKDTRLVGAA